MPRKITMKLKLDDAGHVVVADGKPVYVHDDGKEAPFDAAATVATISRLNAEAKGHREAKEAAEDKLKLFEGLDDPAAARKAMETVKNIDAGALLTAGKVEEIKAAARKAAEEQVAAASKASAEAVAAEKARADKLESALYGEKIGGAFARSKFVSDKLTLPGPAIEKIFGDRFKIEDGRTVAYDSTGNKIFSRSKPGEVADFDEALELLIDQWPYKDSLLRGVNQQGGGGKPGNGAGKPGQKTINRGAYDALNPTEQALKIRDGYTVVDSAA